MRAIFKSLWISSGFGVPRFLNVFRCTPNCGRYNKKARCRIKATEEEDSAR
jgi:hypothetical protein